MRSSAIITASRYHDISCGHRVVGHEGKCRFMHGHNYRIHFDCASGIESRPVDDIGRVIDFSVIKERLCMWLEEEWDHKFLIWAQDEDVPRKVGMGFVVVPFNPTAENMASYLLEAIGPSQMAGTGVTLVAVRIEETRKCCATARLPIG